MADREALNLDEEAQLWTGEDDSLFEKRPLEGYEELKLL